MIPSTSMLAGFSFFVVFACYGGVMSTYLNNNSLIGRQTIFVSLAAVSSFILKLLFVKKWNAEGAIWATLIGYAIFYVVPSGMLVYRSLGSNLKFGRK